MFSSDKKQDLQKEQMQSVNPPDLSRTTFGMKNSKSPAEPTSSSHVPREEYNNLKLMVTNMVVEKDKELRHRLNDITDDLNKKTVALNKMKRTLVSKLKELENSLIAPSQEFNRSLDADATSSHEERGESQLAEVNEKKRKLERDLEQNKDLLEAKIRENQNLSQDLVKLKNDLQVNRGELETTIAKQKACELEIELKKFEVSELEKFKIKQSKQINELQQKIFDQEDNFKIEKLKSNKNLEAQIFKLQDLESQQIKGKLELSNKIKSKEKELSLKTSLVEDYKNQIKQMGDEISMLKIQNNKLSLSQHINPAEGQEGSLSNLLNTDEEEDETSKRLKELKQLIASDPTKASNDLFRLCFDTAKEYRILKKTTEILEDNIDEGRHERNEV
jgi:chromosome segregation ATPase